MPSNNNEIEKRLWDAADELRANSNLTSAQYSVPVLGLIFLRFADSKFQHAAKELAQKATGRRSIGKSDYQVSQIDFETLRKKFEQGRKRTEAEKLKGLISRKLAKLVQYNRTRLDFLEKFQEMIDLYNSGAHNVEAFFEELIKFIQELEEEEKRAIVEELSEEELAVFDLLTKPDIKLTKKEEVAVKNAAQELLETLKREKLVLDWRRRQQSRAAVWVTIEKTFDELLPETYTKELYEQKCHLIYQHVYDSYYGEGKSVYPAAS